MLRAHRLWASVQPQGIALNYITLLQCRVSRQERWGILSLAPPACLSAALRDFPASRAGDVCWHCVPGGFHMACGGSSPPAGWLAVIGGGRAGWRRQCLPAAAPPADCGEVAGCSDGCKPPRAAGLPRHSRSRGRSGLLNGASSPCLHPKPGLKSVGQGARQGRPWPGLVDPGTHALCMCAMVRDGAERRSAELGGCLFAMPGAARPHVSQLPQSFCWASCQAWQLAGQ